MTLRTRTRTLLGSIGLLALTAPAVAVVASSLVAASAGAQSPRQRMIVLGFDGMDHEFTTELIEQGRLPNLARVAQQGGFSPLETAYSPQSPVAWSNFITGLDSGGHGIFDFLHREVEDSPFPFGTPYQATSKEIPVGRTIDIGKWRLPLSGGGIELARYGDTFWQQLEENGFESTMIRMPANFPPVGVGTYELSGMGTPDLRGTSGEFHFFTTDRTQFNRNISGGKIYPADVVDGVFEGALYGPPHPLLIEPEELVSEFTAYIDADVGGTKLVVGDEELLLEAGEWSDWVEVEFELIPYLQSISGIVRFYLKSVEPEFELYVSPIQMDPMAPAMPISSPEGFAAEMAEATGRFYTQEMPEDTKAIQWDLFDTGEFVHQASIIGRENRLQYDWMLDNWTGEFLFYYVGNLDQLSHVLWGVTLDPGHPAHVPELHEPYADTIPQAYERLDEMVGRTLDYIDETGDDITLVVMSDHGFTSWRRSFHLNTWLVDSGYMELERRTKLPVADFWTGVNWRRTQAYGLGISGLYLNLRGREPRGVVAPGDRQELIEQLERDLLAAIDPVTGQPAVTRVYVRERDFKDRGHLEIGPDIIVGFAKGTRGSGSSALGGMPVEWIGDNLDDWSGDHIMDHETVPGVLFTNKRLGRQATSLQNLAATLLAEFGIEGFPDGSTPVTLEPEPAE